MRILQLVLALILMCTSVFAQEFLGERQPFHIKGKINHYVGSDKNGFITLRTNSITGKSKDSSLSIKNDGSFEVTASQDFDGDLMLMYDECFITLYATSGEEIGITIDQSNLGHEKNITQAVNVTGRSADISREMSVFLEEFHRKEWSIDVNFGDTTVSEKEFAQKSAKLVEEKLAFIESYKESHQIKNGQFLQWARNEAVFSVATNAVLFPFMGRVNRQVSIDDLISYSKYVPITDPSILSNASSYQFLNSLATSIQIVTNVNPMYESEILEFGKSKMGYTIKQIQNRFQGIPRDLMLLDCYNPLFRDISKLVPSIREQIKNAFIRRKFEQEVENSTKPFITFNVLNKIKTQSKSDSLQAWFSSFLKENKGNYIYIDFWGSWCGPCMMEMNHYSKLIDSLTDRKIRFLFLAVETTEHDVLITKNKNHIEGKFVTLTNNETRIFNNVFEFSSYPHHVLIDDKGNICELGVGGLIVQNGVSELGLKKLRKLVPLKN